MNRLVILFLLGFSLLYFAASAYADLLRESPLYDDCIFGTNVNSGETFCLVGDATYDERIEVADESDCVMVCEESGYYDNSSSEASSSSVESSSSSEASNSSAGMFFGRPYVSMFCQTPGGRYVIPNTAEEDQCLDECFPQEGGEDWRAYEYYCHEAEPYVEEDCDAAMDEIWDDISPCKTECCESSSSSDNEYYV